MKPFEPAPLYDPYAEYEKAVDESLIYGTSFIAVDHTGRFEHIPFKEVVKLHKEINNLLIEDYKCQDTDSVT